MNPRDAYIVGAILLVTVLCCPLVVLWVKVRRARAARKAMQERLAAALREERVRASIGNSYVPKPRAWPPAPLRTPPMPAVAAPRRREEERDTGVFTGWAPQLDTGGLGATEPAEPPIVSGGGGDFGGAGASGSWGDSSGSTTDTASSSSSSSSDSGGGNSGGGDSD